MKEETVTLGQVIDAAEQALGRALVPDELTFVGQMHRAGKDTKYIVDVLEEPVPPEPSDDELVTTQYEATMRGAQDITGLV